MLQFARMRIFAFAKKYFLALIFSLYLFTLGLASARNRAFLDIIAGRFGRGSKKNPPTILPEISWNDLLPDPPPMRLLEPEATDGNVSTQELVILNSLAARFNPLALFEFGTFDGRTTLNLAANSPREARVYTLDLSQTADPKTSFPLTGDRKFISKNNRRLRFQNREEEQKITALYGDSAKFDASPFLKKMDFIFVDGAHTYQYVRNDSEKAMAMLKDRGVILWHDYGVWEGVTRALNEFYQTGPEYKNLKRIRGTSLALLIR